MATKMIWAENPTLPKRPIQLTEAQFKIYRTNGWVEIDSPDIDPDSKQPAKATAERPPSDKNPASLQVAERPPSDKKAAPSQEVVPEVPVKKKTTSSRKKTGTRKSSE